MSMITHTAVEDIPKEVAGTPVKTVKSDAQLPCPHTDCIFRYWNVGNRQGKRTPTVQDKFTPHDEPCEHFIKKWSPTDGKLESALKEAATNASTIYCVIDKQLPLDGNAQTIAIYIDKQTTLGGF